MLQLDARTQVKDYRDKIDEPHNARFQESILIKLVKGNR